MSRTEKFGWLIAGVGAAMSIGAVLYGAWFVMNCDGIVVRTLFYPPLVCIEAKKITDRFPQ